MPMQTLPDTCVIVACRPWDAESLWRALQKGAPGRPATEICGEDGSPLRFTSYRQGVEWLIDAGLITLGD